MFMRDKKARRTLLNLLTKMKEKNLISTKETVELLKEWNK